MHPDTNTVPTLGMGCWPIGGPFFRGTQPLGYAGAEDGQSIKTIHAALDHGVTLFDTAAAYGCGHAEYLLGQALRGRSEARVVTKVGLQIDETTKQLVGPENDPAQLARDIDACLRRLDREQIDLLLLHQNDLPPEQAALLFDVMDQARQAGKIGAYGWSTDFPDSIRAMAPRDGFDAVEFSMNLYHRAEGVRAATGDMLALIRSPLAMGLLGGRYGAGSVLPAEDIRSTNEPWRGYFEDARPMPDVLAQLEAVRDLLTSGGRSLAQGALGWLWAVAPGVVPIPGARTPEQIADTAGAIAHGPLPADVLESVERLMARAPEGPPRAR